MSKRQESDEKHNQATPMRTAEALEDSTAGTDPAAPSRANAPFPAVAEALAPTSQHSGRSRAIGTAVSAGSKRTAAADASDTLPSVDEAEEQGTEAVSVHAAPAVKRARTTRAGPACASSSSSQSPVAQSAPMIRLLGRDTGAQFALCEMLELNDLAAVHSTGRSWRRWLDEGQFGSNRELVCHKHVAIGLRSCRWVRRNVHKLSIGETSNEYDNSVPRYQNQAEHERGTLAQIALRLLPLFPRLHAFKFELHEAEADDAHTLNQRLAQAAPNLTDLSIHVSRPWHIDPFIPVFLPSVHQLSSLISLKVVSGGYAGKDADFSALPQLPHLRTFSFLDGDDGLPGFCSKAQVTALIACRSLTELDAGDWGPSEEEADTCRHDAESGEIVQHELSKRGRQQLDEGLVALLQGRKLNGAAPFRKFSLGSPGWVTPSIAEHFLAMTDLESLAGLNWSCGLTADHWNQLCQLTHLHTLRIAPIGYGEGWIHELDSQRRALLKLDTPLAALQHCPALSSLTLSGPLTISTAHAALLASFPRLRKLTLWDVQLESLQPLANAPSLIELTLNDCGRLDGHPMVLGSTVPVLPLLTSLYFNGQLSLSAADVSLLASFPRLQSLRLAGVKLDRNSLAPLRAAPTLFHLEFSYCHSMQPGAKPCIRSMIPLLPRLSSLSIYDGGLYSAEEAAPINASMFLRLPMLDPRDFEEWHRVQLSSGYVQLVHSGRCRKQDDCSGRLLPGHSEIAVSRAVRLALQLQLEEYVATAGHIYMYGFVSFIKFAFRIRENRLRLQLKAYFQSTFEFTDSRIQMPASCINSERVD